MRNQECILSPLNRKRLESQGYGNLTDKELIEFRFGMRFAYALCAFIVFLGLLFQSKTLLICAAAAAFLGTFPPFHPFDYLYNYAVRFLFRKPGIPARTNQGRFACGTATVWLVVTILLFSNGHIIAANIMGCSLLLLATLVSTTDLCVPSLVYNFFLK